MAIELVLRAPSGTDTASVIAGLRDHIPPGATLEERDGEHPAVPAIAH